MITYLVPLTVGAALLFCTWLFKDDKEEVK